MSNILIIDDDAALCRSLEIQLNGEGHQVRWARTAAAGFDLLDQRAPTMLFLDISLPDRSGLDVLKEIAGRAERLPVVMITGRQDMSATIEAMRSGAFDYLRKPFDLDEMKLAIDKCLQYRDSSNDPSGRVTPEIVSDAPHEIVGGDRSVVEVIKQIGLLSRSQVTVLIQGESGSGKELVARALHHASAPAEPFVAVNCSAIVASLGESELFGHERGAFTGAIQQKTGKLEHAAAGSVFLDEIGDMPVDLQAKLLRTLQEREFERVGGLRPIPFRARVMAATHRDLAAMVAEGVFREDLYYRLAVTSITLPPLRERRGDIPLLVRHLSHRISRKLHRPIAGIDDEAMASLIAYDWPGNVRELENVLTRAVALAPGDVVTKDTLAYSIGVQAAGHADPSMITTLATAEKAHIEKALFAFEWNITQTAKALDISPTTLRKKIGDYQLKRP